MAENSTIEWTTHTFNPWWGCVKVSPACKHCYAEAWAKRVGSDVWGIKSDRRFLSDAHWRTPLQWNARETSQRQRVFCASMADVFEDRLDLVEPRARLWKLIEDTPNLDWLILTKRPENIADMSPWGKDFPKHIWLGVTVEDQKRAEERLPCLEEFNASVKFISAEPLLGRIDIRRWLGDTINWVITGGESGPKARPTSPSWFTDLHSQCMAAEVAFHFKQWGDWTPGEGLNFPKLRHERVEDGTEMIRVGKKDAGRVFQGTVWDELPWHHTKKA